ncbi:MYND-type domain-containing protein [Mycena sanguinolenta]|uniref:MYND-type domain-containing protein n=1 Tax=Mycena sanguinolenta TaxID=230812 RepID=A0A8H6YT23_9AGAR|nr:MYND-type domain-containing protein [Mycena sanguinolenta]
MDYLHNWDDVSRVLEVGCVLTFASTTAHHYASGNNSSGDNAWLSALQSQKYAPALVATLSLVEHVAGANGDEESFHRIAWDLLFELLRVGTGYADITNAIRAGLLQCIVSLPNTHADWDMSKEHEAIQWVIQPATLYYPVLSAIEASLPLLTQSTSTTTFTSSVLHADWKEFVDLVLDRLTVKKGYDSGQYLTRKACDNLECGRILKKTEFKRCAGCRYVHYCSRDCQIEDWSTDHKSICQSIRAGSSYFPSADSEILQDGHNDVLDGPTYLTSRDRAFIRAIIRADYERFKQVVFCAMIVRMREFGENVVVSFDYRTGRVEVRVHPPGLVDYIAGEPSNGYFASRMAQNDRRMQLNIAVLPHAMLSQSSDGCRWKLPIRSSNSSVHDALFTLSQSLPPGSNDLSSAVHRAVDQLVEEVCPTILEIV